MVTAISFCLYGPPNPKYYTGLMENITLIRTHFPTFYIYIYIGNDVPTDYIHQLLAYPHVILRYTHAEGSVNMIHRFFAIDEPEVGILFVRDADSRVHWKDRWAMREFLRHPSAILHTIRDHPDHTAPIMGGLWGIKKVDGLHIQQTYANYTPSSEHRLGLDQNFLTDCIHPKYVDKLLVHSSLFMKCHPAETLVMFPFTYTDDIYCGRVEIPPFRESAPPPNHILRIPQALKKY
jgi:hypothetical protein